MTIRSRCRNISFNRADRQSASGWLRRQVSDPARIDNLLELAGGAPLKALDLDGVDALQNREEMLEDLQEACRPVADPVRIAEKWQKHDLTEVLNRLLQLFSKMAALRASGTVENTRRPGCEAELRRMAERLPLTSLLDCYDMSLKNYHLLTGETNLNKQSLLEEIIVHWQSIHRGKSADDAD